MKSGDNRPKQNLLYCKQGSKHRHLNTWPHSSEQVDASKQARHGQVGCQRGIESGIQPLTNLREPPTRNVLQQRRAPSDYLIQLIILHWAHVPLSWLWWRWRLQRWCSHLRGSHRQRLRRRSFWFRITALLIPVGSHGVHHHAGSHGIHHHGHGIHSRHWVHCSLLSLVGVTLHVTQASRQTT